MSLGIDPTKKSYVAPTTAPSTPPKAEKPTLKQEPPATSAPTSLGYLFEVPQLKGPGVSATVFGPTFPDPRKMSAEQLAEGIHKLGTAIRKHPGQVNDADMKLHGALVAELAAREQLLLDDKTPTSKLDNQALFHQLLAFDMAKQGGMTLSPAQQKRHAELEKEMKARGSNDLSGEIAKLEHLREETKSGARVHCGAAAAGAFSLATHIKLPHYLATAAVTAHAVKHGHLRDAAIEVGLIVIGKLDRRAEKATEAAAIALNAAECRDDLHTLAWTAKALEELKAKAGAK